MGLFNWISLCGVGIWLAPRVRNNEPWWIRWGWLLSISMIVFGVTSGTRASWQKWVVGTTQAWLAAGICCEVRLHTINKRQTGADREKR